jgi:5,10-methylenetetrahydrofolate reductase
MNLRSALLDPQRRFVFLYGTTPPRADAAEDRILRAAARLAERTRGLDLDGLVVYDVQDESGRTSEPRPFPFLPTLDSRTYARLLEATTGRPAITYKCVAQTDESEWQGWLDETAKRYGLRHLSLVGRATSKPGPSGGIPLSQALTTASAHPAGFTRGGVVIPERHRPDRSESERLLHKAAAGCEFFISQAVYAPEAVIALCGDYRRACEVRGVTPRRIILTFTPCGRPETLRFLQWLGVYIPAEVQQALLTSPTQLAESIRTCVRSLGQILDSGIAEAVPLGVNVESVSIKKDEIEASVDLCAALRGVVQDYSS